MATARFAAVEVELGARRYDLTYRTLVMGILNRTPDSFYDRGATWEFDAFLRRAEELVADGRRPPRRRRREGRARARGGRGRGARPGRAGRRGAARALRRRRSRSTRGGRRCSTPRARPARSSATTSAGSPTPTTSRVRRAARRVGRRDPHPAAPRVADPNRTTTTSSATSRRSSLDRARAGRGGRHPAEQIVLDAGLDLGKTPAQSAVLLRESSRSRRSATRCCSRRRTSASSVSCSSSTSTTAARNRRRARARRRARVSGPASPRCALARRRTADVLAAVLEAGVVTVHLRARRRPGPSGAMGSASCVQCSSSATNDRALRCRRRSRDDDATRRRAIVDAARDDPAVPHRARGSWRRHDRSSSQRQDDRRACSSNTSPTRSTRPSWCSCGAPAPCTRHSSRP